MTTDPFTDADLADYARAEAETRWPQRRTGHYVQQLAFVAGAEWAREHLAAQEPTDAEVEAAARVICEGTEAGDLDAWGPETQRRFRSTARAALSAARAARRDEEDKP